MAMKTKEMESLEQALGYEFKNTELIIEALTHRSYRHENQSSFDNERLEFLGDAVLDLCISELLMQLCPAHREGQLSKIRSQLVSEQSLAKIAKTLNLGEALQLGRGEEQGGGRVRASMLADALEALIAAIYLDSDFNEAKKVILKVFSLHDVSSENWQSDSLLDLDSKSKLQEQLQAEGYPAPIYQCLKVSGPEHKRIFTMALMLLGVELNRAKSHTKKEATQVAAREVLDMCREKGLLNFLEEKGVRAARSKNISKLTIKQKAPEKIEESKKTEEAIKAEDQSNEKN